MASDILDLDVVVRRLTSDARARLSADAVAVWLLALDGRTLELRADVGFMRASTARALAHRPSGDLTAWMTARRPPSLSAVPASPPKEGAWLVEESICSVLAMPLLAGRRRIGLLAAFRRRRSFTRGHLAAARALAAEGAAAVQAALRFANEREHAARTETLLAVTQTLVATSDLPAALDEVARCAAAALGADRCEIDLAHAPRAACTPVESGRELVVPIRREHAAIGSLRLVRRRAGGEWAPKIVDMATAIAGQIALAVENARLVRQAEAHAGELAALLDVAATLTSTLDLPTVLEAIADAARTLIGAQRCAVFELDAAQRLVPRVSRGVPIDMLLTLEPGRGAVGAAALRRAPFFTPDWRELEPPGYDADRVGGGELMRDAVDRQGIRSVLAVPVISKDALVGVVSVAWQERHEYDEREVRLLAGLAQHAAVALDNARLYDAAQAALANLTAMQEKLVRGETLRALGELAGGAAHHLNNLLTIVVGRVQLLLRGADDERLRRPLAIIEKAAKDGAEVVRRLQQFSRTQQVGRVALLTLDDVARDVLELTRGHWQDGARARGVTIDVDRRLAGGTGVVGDAAALREAVTNVVLNAIDAMPKGGRLTVETRADGERMSLVVTDTGIGMPESVRLKAHEPFFTTKGVKATGLGLSVAYGIVRSHAGELALDSREGHGTSVRITLPRAVPHPAAPSPATPREGALRLLLVDDESEVREAMAEMLASHGHTVLTAAGADEALERLEAEPDLDLVLTDLVMPGRTGWDVAAGVKARRPLIPVGLITGWGDTTDVDASRRAMVDFVVEKPVSVEALQDAVARVRER